MARNSNAAEGLWFASPRDTSLDKATDVYWFESAFDAMAYYQLTKEHIKESIHGYEQMQSEKKALTAETLKKKCVSWRTS